MRRTLLLAVALFTFLLGVMLGVLHRQTLNSLDEPANIEALVQPLDYQDSLTVRLLSFPKRQN